jgi:hypothetical protein
MQVYYLRVNLEPSGIGEETPPSSRTNTTMTTTSTWCSTPPEWPTPQTCTTSRSGEPESIVSE